MAVDLFALRMNMEVTGAAQATAALRGIETQGARTGAAMHQGSIHMDRATSAALNGTKGFKDLSAAYANQDRVMAGMTGTQARTTAALGSSTTAMAAGAAAASRFSTEKRILSTIMSSGLVRFFALAGAVDLLRRGYNGMTEASDRLVKTTLMIEGTARMAGVPLQMLQRVAAAAQRDFRMSAASANEFAASAALLATKAGDIGRTTPFLRAWMDAAASRGIDAKEALLALNITLRGQDEGLDRLFQRNPSAFWKD